jgi:membrane-associated protein
LCPFRRRRRTAYSRFIAYNIIGGFIWIYAFTYAGYWFGNRPFVQQNFKLVILAIIVLSIVPIVWEFVRALRENKKTPTAER